MVLKMCKGFKMKNKKSKQKKNDIFFTRLIEAVQNDTEVYVDEDAINITIATLELIWSNYNITEFTHSYQLNEKDYDKYFKNRIEISHIQQILFNHTFPNDNIDEVYNEDEKRLPCNF